MLWVAAPVLAAVTAGSVYVVVEHRGRHDSSKVFGEKFVASGSGATSGAAPSLTNGNGGVGNGNVPGSPGKAFSMTGTINTSAGLGPGNPVYMHVHVSNAGNNQPMQVMKITGTTSSVSVTNSLTPACDPTWVTVTPYNYDGVQADAYIAPGRGATDVPVLVTFADKSTNQDSCKGATFTIALTGTGRQA